MFPRWFRLRVRGENEKTRDVFSGAYHRTVPERRRSIARLDFRMVVFLKHLQIYLPILFPICHLLLPAAGSAECKRQHRGTEVWWRKVGNGEEKLAFSGNFPVAPCTNIYREYRDLCKLLYVYTLPARIYAHARTYVCMYDRICTWTRGRLQYASGSSVNTCIKMSAFACLHPLLGRPPSGLLHDPFRAPRSRARRYTTQRRTTAAPRRPRVCMHSVKMSLDLERANRMLTFPARRGMITLTTYIGARERNHVSAPPFYLSRKTIDANARP